VPRSTREREPARYGWVIVGLDAWHPDFDAVRLAAQEAALRGDRLRIVVCWETNAAAALSVDAIALLRSTEPEHAGTVGVLAREHQDALPSDHVEITVIEGNPARQLVQWTASADLVVIGNRRLPLWRRTFDHSTSGFVVHHAHGPVLVVPSATPPADRLEPALAGAAAETRA
jgi:nucleotide-binding universal stress UspA family protein